MSAFETLALRHSWPLDEQDGRFDLGLILNSVITDALDPESPGSIAAHHAGCWECDLADNQLVWSGGVYDIFGLPRGVRVTRDDAVRLYSEESRAKMERLRAYAIQHRRGFTLDADVNPVTGGTRRMRLICAPVCEGGLVTRLHGLKLIV